MKTSSVLSGVLAIALTGAIPAIAPSTASAELDGSSAKAPTAKRLIVKLEAEGVSARSSAQSAVARVSARPPKALGGNWYLVRGIDDLTEARATLTASPGVRQVQVDHIRRTFGDPYYRRYQPYLRASMDIDTAWKRSSGRGVTVAVVDTGVDPNHEDLPRPLRGRDFVGGDNDASDPNGHGTFVAGVIAAKRNNGRGIAGVSRAAILPVRVLNARGFGRDSDISRGIRWAASNGADVINLSLGGGRSSRILRDAVRAATRKGALVVAASGNSGGTRPMYPAAYKQVVAVGATDLKDRMTWFTDHGPWLDVVAPGVDIISTVPRNGYAIGDGTSFSSPLVAGAAALALSDHRRWSASKLRAALIRGAADAGPVGPDPFTGVGVIDVDGLVGGRAKRSVSTTDPTSGTTPITALPLSGGSIVPTSNPEGTARWFRLDIADPTTVTVTATMRAAKSGVRRGDIELAMYDSSFGRLDNANDRSGAGKETVRAVVDDVIYVRVRNTRATRWPSPVKLGLDQAGASAANVQVGSAPRPTLVETTPVAESYRASRSGTIALLLGSGLAANSINPRSVQLIDGETGLKVSRDVSVSGQTLTITPDSTLGGGRTYSVTLIGLRTSGGRSLSDARVGFRTVR
ncbi:MAG TPA: S8 family serine peptidase [Actinomycetes bacterium]|nr:S8 family serine peptidase [Actinomycetes bacterium]